MYLNCALDFLLKSDRMKLETNERKQKSGTHEPDVVGSNLTGPMREYMFRKVHYSGRTFSVEVETSSAAGKKLTIERVVHPAFAVIVPFLSDDTIILERQYRGAIKRYVYELPAGTMEKGENPVASARRELEEETGYVAGRMRFLFKAYTTPGFTTELAYVFAAKGLTRGRINLDKDEIIETSEVGLAKAVGMIKSNRIVDMKTIAAILFCVHAMRRKP